MALVQTQYPYEFLARWKDGKFAGAHVQFVNVITDDETGKVVSTVPLDVMPVDIGQGKGFPLADVLKQLQVDAIKQTEVAQAAQAEAEKTALDAQAKAAEMTTALNAAIDQLGTQLASLNEAKARLAPAGAAVESVAVK